LCITLCGNWWQSQNISFGKVDSFKSTALSFSMTSKLRQLRAEAHLCSRGIAVRYSMAECFCFPQAKDRSFVISHAMMQRTQIVQRQIEARL
jgi:hypothetical protein